MLSRLHRWWLRRSQERLDQRYPSAGQFFGGYLHQDWPEESGTWEVAAHLFLSKESPAHAKKAVEDLDRLLGEVSTESELQRVLDAFGNAYDPAPAGLSLRAWLTEVRGLLASGRDHNPAV